MIEGYERQVVLLSLLQALRSKGSWSGETHVQKSTFFLEEGLGVPLGLEFFMYKYGPFSSDLRQLLGEMRSNYLIEIEPRAPYGPSLVVSDTGHKFAARFPRASSRYKSEIDFVAVRLGTRSVADLERLSTALFVRKESNDFTDKAPASRIIELKPHVDPNQAKEAVATVRDLLQEAAGMGLVGRAATTS